eukprot:CAMPEP_0196718638 /NCGR_PEP_ID=MMETSP1091-20130531/1797_1 /TAXON_ID=302021 /ORGANISM="Rhodomonas sp., Strain CCMP768" /LENGTH=74 /DNA_ID=CAMNT_0042059353 /DNA_START=16 /DNA_END=240 /DNA_ORIENTATION=+
MFESLIYFNISNNYGGISSCEQSPTNPHVEGWVQGTCSAAGFGHLWDENRKTGLATFRNFKKLGSVGDPSNNAA